MKRYALLLACILILSPAYGQGVGGAAVPAINQGIGNLGTGNQATGNLGTGAANAGGLGNTGAAATTSGNTGSGGNANTSVGIDAAEAFSGVQRGQGAGTTAGTGSGFSPLSIGNGQATGGSFGAGGFGGLGGFGGFGNAFGRNQFNQGAADQPTIRTRLRSAVAVAPRTAESVARNVRRSYSNRSTASRLGNVGIVIDGRTAIVSGTVANDHDRRISELLLRLEPGIDRVENRVQVSPAP